MSEVNSEIEPRGVPSVSSSATTTGMVESVVNFIN